MGNLLVRNVDNRIIQELKSRAGKHGVSAEAEHRSILASALIKPVRKSFTEAVMQIPPVGEDSDFERQHDDRDCDVFD